MYAEALSPSLPGGICNVRHCNRSFQCQLMMSAVLSRPGNLETFDDVVVPKFAASRIIVVAWCPEVASHVG